MSALRVIVSIRKRRNMVKEQTKGNRGKVAFASANEIAPAIGGCLLAFDVRLVNCTGCDPLFEGFMAPPITDSWTVRGLRFLVGQQPRVRDLSEASNRHVASLFFLREESYAFSNLAYTL